MLVAKANSKENNIISSIIPFPNNTNLLDKYLETFVISEDLFNYNAKTIGEKIKLKKYYDLKKEIADRLVLDDEYVGKTYYNLETICKILSKTR